MKIPAIDGNPLTKLAAAYWIEPQWQDAAGQVHYVPDPTLCSLLTAAGVPNDTAADVESSLAERQQRPFEPVYVLKKAGGELQEPPALPLVLPGWAVAHTLKWCVFCEDGGTFAGSYNVTQSERSENKGPVAIHVPLSGEVANGYHRLTLELLDPGHQLAASAECTLIVAPDRPFLPAGLEDGNQLWGPLIRLPALRSQRNWGVGEFSDLKDVVSWCAEHGAGVISVEPLQALSSTGTSGGPPSYSSRQFLDPIYLDIEAIPDFSGSPEITRLVLSPEFQARLERLRSAAAVDYAAITAEKYAVLKLLYQEFRQKHLSADTERARSFREFQKSGGESLERFARFEALREWLNAGEIGPADWSTWPKSYQDASSTAVEEFASNNREIIEFHHYLQWQAQIQLQQIGQHCFASHLTLGLALSLPSGVNRFGADTWSRRDLYACEVGTIYPLRADLSLPFDCCEAALLPERLREQRYEPFISAVRRSMQSAGALNIKNAERLGRQFWIPDGLEAEECTFVRYPLEDLLGILVLESHRNKCLLIARQTLKDHDVYQVDGHDEMLALSDRGIMMETAFCSRGGGVTGQPGSESAELGGQWQALYAITFAGDDMTGLTDYWLGRDLSSPAREIDKDLRDHLVSARMMSRMGILRLLEEENLLPEGYSIDPTASPGMQPELAVSIYKAMAMTEAQIMFFSLEDLIAPDAPGAQLDYCSECGLWCLKMPVDLKQVLQEPGTETLARQLAEVRAVPLEAPSKAEQSAPAGGYRIPQSTYRLQFNKDFTLRDATGLVQYLASLGISHCYASPLLRARPGSKHGYDIADHKALNPEIGTAEELDEFVAELHRHGMGLILDFVPNHMGIGKDNPWWMDVLENGPASEFARYFDIEWAPIKPELRGKVLIPTLGDSYGRCLTGGQLKLSFKADEGKLLLEYFEHQFPINPKSYPVVLGHRLDVLKERLGKDNIDVLEYQSILAALERLPNHIEPIGFAERQREKRLQIMRLTALCRRNEEIGKFISQNLSDFDCSADDPTRAERLNSLLQKQAFRLANWRVASDEINYRRFFDINDLAALRVEDQRVFAEIHEFVFELISKRKLDGLRIDHPDGLYDPAGYFAHLQNQTSQLLGLDTAVDGDNFSYDELPLYLVAEKILAPFEHLPADFATHGTTGYDFLNSLNQVLTASQNEEAITKLYEDFIGKKADYEELRYECKYLIQNTVLNSDLQMLAHQLDRISESSWFYRDYTLESLRRALATVVCYFPVYRTYVGSTHGDKTAEQYVDWAVKLAKKRSATADTTIYEFIHDALLAKPLEGVSLPSDSDLAQHVRHFAMKFQQFTSPVMAKSVEDTLFYRYNRMIGLNEVGGDPQRFGISVAAFHHQNQERQRRRHYELLSTSTHDTKRSEDVRARLSVLSEIPQLWREKVFAWSRINEVKKTSVEDGLIPVANDEYFIYQALAGFCPPDIQLGDPDSVCRRLSDYALKAAREAKVYTSWTNQNEEYEKALLKFTQGILAGGSNPASNLFLEDFLRFNSSLAYAGLLNSLTQTLLKLTSPGVPDLYQGNEFWDFSLVDPDNRRPVDFKARTETLADMERILRPCADSYTQTEIGDRKSYLSECFNNVHDGRLKQFVSVILLRLRRQFPGLLSRGRYLSLQVSGKGREHVVAFAREHEHERVIAVAPRLVTTLLERDSQERFYDESALLAVMQAGTWADTAVILPEDWKNLAALNVFTLDDQALGDGQILLSSILRDFPVALLRVKSRDNTGRQ